MTTRTTAPRSVTGAARRAAGRTRRRRPSAATRRRRRGCAAMVLISLVTLTGLGVAILTGAGGIRDLLGPAIESGPEAIRGIPAVAAVPWGGEQPRTGVDVSFPQCGRTLRDTDGFAIVGLDGGMPDRANPCFVSQWRFALRQAGAAIYVNTADSGRGDPSSIGRRAARGDLAALRAHHIGAGTPVWLDVELPEVWMGSQARHRAVITAHLKVLASAGYPVGVYSAPALWEQITGDAALDVPTWVGIGNASAGRAAAACDARLIGGRRPDLVQRIATGSDGRPLDRSLTCPGVDLAGRVAPN